MKFNIFAVLLFLAHIACAQDTIRLKTCTRVWQENVPLNSTNIFVNIFQYGTFTKPTGPNGNCVNHEIPLVGLSDNSSLEIGAEKVPGDEGAKWLNGVSVRDLLLISRHILGLDPLPGPFAVIAADANRSNSLTTLDIAELKKLILGEYPLGLPNNSVWRFSPDYLVFSHPTNPFVLQIGAYDFNIGELKKYNNKTLFVNGIKVGDVDNDVSLNKPYSGPAMKDSIDLWIPDITVQPDTAIIVPVYLRGTTNISAMQASFIATDAAKIIDVKSGSINVTKTDYFFPSTPVFPRNRVRIALMHNVVVQPLGYPINIDKPVFNLKISATAPVKLRDVIKILPSDLPSFAVARLQGATFNDNYPFRLRFESTVSENNVTKPGLRFEPPIPNPFSDQTIITLEMPATDEVLLEVFDLNGRITWQNKQTLNEGWQNVVIPGEALPKAGLGVLKVRVADKIAVIKLMKG